MGFGHRVYKSYDPRAKIIKKTADEVFEVTGKNPLLDIALELERIALQDEYFVTRKLYPERGLLLRPHLPGDGLPGGDVPGAVRDPAHVGLDCAVGGDDPRPGAEDRAAEAGVHRGAPPRLRAAHEPELSGAGVDAAGGWTAAFTCRWPLAAACRAARACAAPAPQQPRQPAAAARRRAHGDGQVRRARARGPTCSARSGSGRGRRARRPWPRPASTSSTSSRPPASAAQEQPFTATTPAGAGADGQRHRHHPRPPARAHRAGQPLRHQARAVPVRRRQRRRLVHGGAARAGTRRSPTAQPDVHDRAAVPRRRGGGELGLGRHRQHLRQPPLRAGGAEGRHARRR